MRSPDTGTRVSVAATLHDLDNTEAIAAMRLDLNMPAIVQQALTPKAAPVWRLDIDCHAAPYKWTGMATSEGAATLRAMSDLSDSHAEFNRYKARVVACVQVAA